MLDAQHISYKCTPETFHPAMLHSVRWLDWERDYPLVEEFWPDQTRAGWRDAREQAFQYCAVVEHNQIQAFAAVWRYSKDAWEVASVYSRPEVRRQGYAKSVVSFVTAYILEVGRDATCSTAVDNQAMQRVLESVGFQQIGS